MQVVGFYFCILILARYKNENKNENDRKDNCKILQNKYFFQKGHTHSSQMFIFHLQRVSIERNQYESQCFYL